MGKAAYDDAPVFLHHCIPFLLSSPAFVHPPGNQVYRPPVTKMLIKILKGVLFRCCHETQSLWLLCFLFYPCANCFARVRQMRYNNFGVTSARPGFKAGGAPVVMEPSTIVEAMIQNTEGVSLSWEWTI